MAQLICVTVWEVIGPVPVSYTHLDVYKRQALDHGVLGQETTGAAGLSFAMRSVPALAAYCELITNCLLYTSRCV